MPKDRIEAYKWYVLSGDENTASTVNRLRVGLFLTPEQADEAKRRAREWTPQTRCP